MSYIFKLFFILISTVSLAACQFNPVSEEVVMEQKVNKEFIQLLDYEIQNRAFALESMRVAVKDGKDDKNLPFKKAYLALELLNQQRFAHIAEKYQLDMKPRLWTRTRTQIGSWVSALMPRIALKFIHSATIKYVEKLKELESLSQQNDKDFFAYVVAQEEVQATAVGLVLAEKNWLATNMLNKFVSDNSVAKSISGGKRNLHGG